MANSKFTQFMNPVLDALRQLGGSGRPSEVREIVETNTPLSAYMYEQLQSGDTRFDNKMRWAKFYLSRAGYIDSSKRGVWRLTEKGQNSNLSNREITEIIKFVRNLSKDKILHEAELEENEVGGDEFDDTEAGKSTNHRPELLQILKTLDPIGFERFCQRILRESGFERVEVTQRSNDGGIDGKGILRVNPFVSFNVYFQAKRYSGSVGPAVVRDFRGSIMGRADKGIILTTGVFTSESHREALRDGALPIELVDGEKLLDLLEQLELGVKPVRTVTIYEIDHPVFDEYR